MIRRIAIGLLMVSSVASADPSRIGGFRSDCIDIQTAEPANANELVAQVARRPNGSFQI